MLERRMPVKCNGQISCSLCGEQLTRWTSFTRYTQCDLVYRGTLDSGRPNRFGPSRRDVENRFSDDDC